MSIYDLSSQTLDGKTVSLGDLLRTGSTPTAQKYALGGIGALLMGDEARRKEIFHYLGETEGPFKEFLQDLRAVLLGEGHQQEPEPSAGKQREPGSGETTVG